MNILTVSQLTAHIKDLLDSDDLLQAVWLTGEVSNFKRAMPSGHCYFTLKDRGAAISCAMWNSMAAQLPRLPADGEQVLAFGYVSVYEPQGRYQFYVQHLEPAGVGRLYAELEALKARLAAEGLFSEERKRPLPPLPRRIGVVTSPQAAALRDILRTLAVRYPLVEVILSPTAVQGADAPPQIVAALERLYRWSETVEPLDLIIVARGGGSVEELWAFNDEQVARTIAASPVPVVSGVGHETDFTLADFAADLRAPTPTAAAVLATPHRDDLAQQVRKLSDRLQVAAQRRLAAERLALEQARRSLKRASPQSALARQRQRVDDLSQAAARQMRHALALHRARLEGLVARLRGLDPQAVLARGYAIVRILPSGAILTAVRQVQPGDRLSIQVADGRVQSVVLAADQ